MAIVLPSRIAEITDSLLNSSGKTKVATGKKTLCAMVCRSIPPTVNTLGFFLWASLNQHYPSKLIIIFWIAKLKLIIQAILVKWIMGN